MTDLKNALTRKFGPLPAWAWFGLLALAAVLYRRYQGTAAAVGTSTAQAPDVSTDASGAGGGPVTLQPGEAAYDPATGALVSNPALPGAAPAAGSTGGDSGTTVVGGYTADELVTPTQNGAGKRTGFAALTQAMVLAGAGGIGRRRAGAKPTGGRAAPLPVRRAVTVPRSKASVSNLLKRSKATPYAKPAKPRPSATRTATPERGRVAMPRPTALRQRPAPPRITDHEAQKVITHPVHLAAKANTSGKRRR